MRKTMKWILLAALAIFLLSVPYVLSAYPKTLVTEILIFGLFAVSIDILAGFAGRTSLGHGAIFGAAGYIVAYCITSAGGDPWLAALLGIAGSTVVAAIFGALAVRTTGVYFLLLTLALGMVVWGIVYRWTSVTGAENGMRGVVRPEAIQDPVVYYYFVLATVALMMLAIVRFVRSPFGQALRGIKESATRMRTLGYNVPLVLTIAFTVSGFFAGVAGVLGVFLNNFVSPNSVALAQSTQGLLMAILGGIGTLWGGFVGAAVMILLQNLISFYTERWASILGLMFILTMLFAPEGLLGKGRLLSQRWLKRSNQQ
ncbi:MAG TPA: branched-chain amino acid ABC transporter permease [Burkholderiaceae bacterium]|nr:branched-chain amino acid ABC transporter permease [Burkholderiaceae bacterium]